MFKRYDVIIKSRDYFYAGLPSGELFDKWVKAKGVPKDIEDENRADLDLTEEVEVGVRVFRRDEVGLFFRDFQVKACLKEAAQRLGLTKKMKGLKGHLQTGLFIEPRNLYMSNGDGQVVKEPCGFHDVQGRVYTPQGFKSILSKAEYVEDVTLTFVIKMLPFHGFPAESLKETLELCQEIGLGSLRGREEGKFKLMQFAEQINTA